MKIELLCVLFFPLSVIRFKGLCVGRCFSRTEQSVFGVVLRRSTQNDFSLEAVKSRHDGHFVAPFFTETYQKKLLFVPVMQRPGRSRTRRHGSFQDPARPVSNGRRNKVLCRVAPEHVF